MTEEQQIAMAKVKQNIEAMGPEEFRAKLDEQAPGSIYHAFADLQAFSEFLESENKS